MMMHADAVFFLLWVWGWKRRRTVLNHTTHPPNCEGR